MKEQREDCRVAVVIPCYKVKSHILPLLAAIGPVCDAIYVVDDCCPEGTGDLVRARCTDERVRVLVNDENLGVGGAVMRGYREAIEEGAAVIVKLDGDGQMDPALLPRFVRPILEGAADYAKGNRFYDLSNISAMPKVRIFGNAVLSFMTKFSSGYWSVFDPTNGYTAIHANIARRLPFDKISSRYFFETDMLFRLNIIRAKVVDIPMDPLYGEERSNLKVSRILGEFLFKHMRNFAKRLFYNYFLRDMSVASFELLFGTLLLLFGLVYGVYHWIASVRTGIVAATGTVVLSALAVIVGLQFLLNFLAYDIASQPKEAIAGFFEVSEREAERRIEASS